MAKKLTTEDLVLNIIVNSNKAQSEIAKLGRTIQDNNSKLKAAEAEMKKLEKANATSSARYKELQSDVTKYNTVINESKTRLGELNQTMSLQDKSLKQLEQSLRRTRQLWRQATTDTDRKRYADEMEMLNQRIGELRNGGEQTGNALMRMSSKLQQYFAVITAGIAAVVAAFTGIKRATEEYARFDDVLADVMKTTNLTKEEVKLLNEELKNIETRTSQEDLLGLSRIAGKLGYSDIEEITEFVRANNQIIVALNEDLGGNVEETVNKIGKLVDIFKLKDLYSTEEAFLKVGSAINELGMASTANEGYMVEFARRMSGVAPLAGITIEEILGLGATLDQLGQTSEVSSTALSKLFLAMAKDASTYAKYAGMDLKEFQVYLERDFMGAFTKVLQGVKNNANGINELAATLGDLGQDGGRVIGVLGSLANNVDTLSGSIELSNQAMEEGISVTDEYGIKNQSAAGQLEMARKRVVDLQIELGEKLWPVMTAGNSLMATTIQILKTLITFLSDNYKWIVTVTVALAGWTLAANANALAQYAVARASAVATTATRVWNAALRANPIMLVVSGIAALATALYMKSKRMDAATAATKAYTESLKEGERSVVAETTTIERSSTAAMDRSQADDVRLAAVKRLRDIMPDVLKDYTDEQIMSGKAKTAIEEHTKALVKQASVRAMNDKLADLARKKMDEEDRRERGFSGATLGERWESFNSETFFSNDWASAYDKHVDNNIKTIEAQENKLAKSVAKIEGEMLNALGVNEGGNEEDGFGGNTITGSGGTSKGKTATERQADRDKKAREKMLADQEKYRQEVLLKEKSLTEQEEHAHNERLKQAGIYGKKREELVGEHRDTYDALLKQHRANIDKIEDNAIAVDLDRQKKAYEQSLTELRIKHNGELAEITTLEQAKEYLRGTLNEKELAQIRDLRQARKVIQNQQFIKEEELTREHLQNLSELFKQAIASGEFGGIELSEEQKEKFRDQLLEIRKMLSDMLTLDEKDNLADRSRRHVDILGMSQTDWDRLFKNIQNGIFDLEDLYDVLGAVTNMFSSYSNLVAQKENAMLQNDQRANEKKKDNLKQRLDAGTISQESYNRQVENMDKEMDRKRAEIARKQAKRDKAVALMSAIVNTATGVTRVLASPGGIAGLILAGIIGAFGAVQTGIIASTPLPSVEGREGGGYLKVERSQDGKVFNAKVDPERRGFVQEPTVIVGENGSEWVASAQAVKNPTVRPILDVLDTAQKNGTISTMNLQDIIAGTIGRRSVQGREVGGYLNRENQRSDNGQDPRLYEVLNRLDGTVRKLEVELKNLKSEVVISGKNGFAEKWREYNDIVDNNNL